MTILVTTLNQMVFLFLLIAIGFILVKCKSLKSESASVLSKLENTVFVPALVLGIFMENFTVERISSAGMMFAASMVVVSHLASCITIPIVFYFMMMLVG